MGFLIFPPVIYLKMKRSLVIIISLSFIHLTLSQEIVKTELQMTFFSVVVSDIEKSLKWYSDNFNFEVTDSVNMTDRGIRIANLKRGSLRFEMIESSNSIDPLEKTPTNSKKRIVQGYFKLGFSVNPFDSFIDELKQKGVSISGDVVTDPQTGKNMVVITDPDGNRIQLFEN